MKKHQRNMSTYAPIKISLMGNKKEECVNASLKRYRMILEQKQKQWQKQKKKIELYLEVQRKNIRQEQKQGQTLEKNNNNVFNSIIKSILLVGFLAVFIKILYGVQIEFQVKEECSLIKNNSDVLFSKNCDSTISIAFYTILIMHVVFINIKEILEIGTVLTGATIIVSIVNTYLFL